MGDRRNAREFAMQSLYRRLVAPPAHDGETDTLTSDARHFAKELIDGVEKNLSNIDKAIAGTSKNWKINRMSAVDQSILRLAVFELLYKDDIPPKVAINEAIELAKKYGTTSSSAFINGILDKIAHDMKKNGSDK